MMLLALENLCKTFGSQAVVQDFSLAIAEGQTVVLLGPSGCGKTTLLRLVAGLETPDRGRITFAGQDLRPKPVHERGFGYVFQDYALFPHKNVSQNVAFGLRMHNWAAAEIQARVAAVLELVGLAGFGNRSIHDLSGGEQQRVALARALAPAPRLLLLDEPLGALDRALRERLMDELRLILNEAGDALGQPVTAIYVTHDQAEAFALADELVVMNRGRIEQQGAPAAVYARPHTPFVARFLGMTNLVPGTWLDETHLQTPLGIVRVAEPGTAGEVATLLLRPEAGEVAAKEGENVVRGRVTDVSFRGRVQRLTLSVPTLDFPLQFELDSLIPLPPKGNTILLWLNPQACLPL